MTFHLVPLQSLPSSKVKRLRTCPTLPNFYVSIEGWRFDKTLRTALYIIELGVLYDDGVMIYRSEHRYSELYKLHKALSKSNDIYSAFPPKKLFGSKDVEFSSERYQQLWSYFDKVSEIRHIDQVPEFNSCFKFSELKHKWHCASHVINLTH